MFLHLRDGFIIEVEAVLDGIAAAVECAMQPDAAIGVAGHLVRRIAPIVNLVADRFYFFERERGL